MELAQVIKALADETRIRILNLLKDGELCVCELEHILNINQSNASRHLNKLTNARLIIYEKRALYVYYQINNEFIKEYPFLSELINKELCKIEKCKIDLDKLEKYKQSGITCENLKATNFSLNKTLI